MPSHLSMPARIAIHAAIAMVGKRELDSSSTPDVNACQPKHDWKLTIVSEDSICGAGQLGFRASLQPWHSFLNRFAEVAPCPETQAESCLWQPSNLSLGHVPELPTPEP